MTRGRKFYLDKERAKLAGVCAGIADYFGWDVTLVRVAWVVATILWSPVMIITYVIAAWLVDPKPYGYSHSRTSDRYSSEPAYAYSSAPRFADVKSRFDRLEERLRSMEKVVTSREFQMDRELRGADRL